MKREEEADEAAAGSGVLAAGDFATVLDAEDASLSLVAEFLLTLAFAFLITESLSFRKLKSRRFLYPGHSFWAKEFPS